MSLLFSGSLARYRAVNWLFCHAGGPIPIFARRVATLAAGRNDLAEIAPAGIVVELQRLRFEIANAAYGPSMAALLDFVDAGQVFFGTDYPFVSVQENVNAFNALPLAGKTRDAIAFANARRLLRREPG